MSEEKKSPEANALEQRLLSALAGNSQFSAVSQADKLEAIRAMLETLKSKTGTTGAAPAA